MNSENLISVNFPNAMSILVVVVVGYFAALMISRFVAMRKPEPQES